MLVDKVHQTLAPSSRVEGVLGRLIRAFPARVLAADDVIAPAPQRTHAPARDASRAGLLARFDAWLWRMQQRETDAWLGQAKDTADLEFRMRTLERSHNGPGASDRNGAPRRAGAIVPAVAGSSLAKPGKAGHSGTSEFRDVPVVWLCTPFEATPASTVLSEARPCVSS